MKRAGEVLDADDAAELMAAACGKREVETILVVCDSEHRGGKVVVVSDAGHDEMPEVVDVIAQGAPDDGWLFLSLAVQGQLVGDIEEIPVSVWKFRTLNQED